MRGLLLGLLLSLSFCAGAAAAKPAVLDVRLGLHPGFTRVVLDLSQEPGYRVFLLESPYRVVIDLTEVEWRLPPDQAPGGRGLVQAMRFGLFAAGTSRLVLDVKEPVGVRNLELLPAGGEKPVRLVLDLAPAGEAAFRDAVEATPLVSSAAMTAVPAAAMPSFVLPPVKPSEAEPKRIVVIDPGHGGVDPGAIGASGTAEKTITLAMARELRRQLEATGRYHVVLTRDSDVFVRLRDRIAVARAARADLFVSLHADAHPTNKLRGASVYTLSEQASDAEAAALAAKENKADLIAGIDLSNENEVVTNILIDLAQRETKNLSVRLAGMLVDELKRETPLIRNSHRFAGFAVLKAPDVPSILLELGYLSSKEDEAMLRSEAHRAKLAASIVRAIDGYFGWQSSLKKS